jgi:hypothetical protein
MDDIITSEPLSRPQQDFFIGLFWQSCHCTTPVINEIEFREHYQSLWPTLSPHEKYRKPSPLVDIVLAVCMQYGTAFIPRSDTDQLSRSDVDSNDASIAGSWYYRRSQTLLTDELESPTLATLQCHIFTIIYLRNASFVNLAHNTVAAAIRTAHILGLHQEPQEDLPRPQKELHRRLWWTLYILDSEASMELGRPWIVQTPQATCKLPADDQELAQLSGANFSSPIRDVTWLNYHVQCVKLIAAARAVHTAFYDKCAEVISANNGKSLYDDAQSLETCADFLVQCLKPLQTWLQNLPDGLKTVRRGAGERFSTDRSAVEVDLFAPLWLQRQRLMLELQYHDLVMSFYRPFICFSPIPSSCTPLADGNAISCLNHAIAVTNIIHQVLTETDVLSGYYEAYKYQWSATLSMVGFSLAYPVCPPTPSARKAVNAAIAVFNIFGNNFAAAASSANITRDLSAKAEILIDRFRVHLAGEQRQLPAPPVMTTAASANSGSSLASVESPPVSSSDETSVVALSTMSTAIQPSKGMEGAIGEFDLIWPGTNGFSVDMWAGFNNDFKAGDSMIIGVDMLDGVDEH